MIRVAVPWTIVPLVLALALAPSMPLAAATPPLDGAALFDRGLGRDGREIVGRSGAGDVALRGAAVACANCHGATAEGGGESWLRAPDLRWFALTKPYGAPRSDGSIRPPYDEAALARTLRTGLAPDGRRLDPAMPRFDLASDEVAALAAHLRRLDRAGGRPPAAFLLAVVAPETEPSRQRREWISACHARYAQRSAAPLALRVERFADAEALAAAITASDHDGRIAALLAPDLIGHEATLTPALRRTRLPVIAPLSTIDPGDVPSLRFAFPGLGAQAAALARLAEESSWPLAVAMPSRDSPMFGAAQAIVDDLRERGRPVELRAKEPVAPASAASAASASSAAAADRGGASALLVLDAELDVDEVADGTRLLVPSALATPSLAEQAGRRGLPLHLAFGYAPRMSGQEHLVSPHEATAAVVCAFLDAATDFGDRSTDPAAWRRSLDALQALPLEGWMTVPARGGGATDVRIVEIGAGRP